MLPVGNMIFFYYTYIMIMRRRALYDRTQTTGQIRRMVRQYAGDLDYFGFNGLPLSGMEPERFFDVVRRIPYRRDIHGTEIVSRPYHIIKNAALGMDCKKKSVLIGAYAHRNKIPYRFVTISRRPDRRIHHIYPQLKINGEWQNYDATYAEYKPNQPKIGVTRVEYA